MRQGVRPGPRDRVGRFRVSTAAAAQFLEGENDEATPFHPKRTVGLRLGQHLVDSLTGHARELGDVVLPERDDDLAECVAVAVQVAERAHTTEYPRVDRQVERVEERA